MPRAFALGLLLLPFVAGGPASAQAAQAPGISGAFLAGESRRPVSGALVALYERGSGYLVDSTYTTNEGRFTLPPPPPGDYFLVSTKGDISKRAGLSYEAGASGLYVEIVHRPSNPSLLSRVWRSVTSLTAGVFGTIGGVLVGYSLKQWEGRSVAEKSLNREVSALRDLASAASQEFEAAATKALKGPLNKNDYRRVLADVSPHLAALDAEVSKDSILEVAFSVRGPDGGRDVSNYRARVARIVRLAGSSDDGVGSGELRARLTEMGTLLSQLNDHSLMQARRRWWQRTGSTS